MIPCLAKIVSRGAIMPDSVGPPRYGELADECLNLSELASDDDIRAHFSKIAANYLVMARANSHVRNRSAPASNHRNEGLPPIPEQHPTTQHFPRLSTHPNGRLWSIGDMVDILEAWE